MSLAREGRLEAFSRALLARARLAWVVLLVITVLGIIGTTNLRTEIDFSGLVGTQSEVAQDLRAYEDRFGALSDDEVFLVEAEELADNAALESLEELILGFQFVDGVQQVFSLFSLPGPSMASAWIVSPEMLALDPAHRLARIRESHPLAAQILSEELDATLVVVVPEPGIDRNALLDNLEAERQLSAPELSLSAVGLPALQSAIGEELLRDLRVLTPAAVIICAFLALLLFRSWRAVAICSLPPVTAVLWFMGYLGWREISIDPVMGPLPVVVIVLCFSQCVHLYFAALRQVHSDRTLVERVARAHAETLPAMLLATVTTIFAFLSMQLPGAPQLDKMSLAGTAGMIFSVAAGAFFAPLLMQALAAPAEGSREPDLLAWIIVPARWLSRHGARVGLGALALLIMLVVLQSQTSIGFRYTEYLPTNSGVARDLARMEEIGLGSDRVFVVVESEPVLAAPDDLGAPASLTNVLAAARALAETPETGDDWLQAIQAMLTGPPLAAADGSAHALPVQLPLTDGQEPADAALIRIETQLADAGLASVSSLVGPNKALLTEGPVLVNQLRSGLYGTIIAITLLIGVVFRSWRVALVALIPNLIPILGVESWLVLSGRELSIMTLIALTVAFGIAVDDTLHMLNRYRLGAGLSHETRVEQALADAGAPMIATTAILLGGLAVTMTSAIPGAVLFGGLIALAVALALLADLFILPGLLHWGAK